MQQQVPPTDDSAIIALCSLWVYSVGAIAVVLLCALFVPKLWLPAVVFGIYILLSILNHHVARYSRSRYAWTTTVVTERTLFATAIVMVAILFLSRYPLVPGLLPTAAAANPDIPYVTILILAPIAFLFSGWAYLRMKGMSTRKFNIIGKIVFREWRLQLRMLMLSSALIAVYTWVYYLFRYSNVNYNSADRFFFIWLPVILSVLSVVKMVVRYVMLALFYSRNIVGHFADCASTTTVRFLVLCGDKLLLGRADGAPQADTPAQLSMAHRDGLTDADLRDVLARVAGSSFKPTDVRLLYENSNQSIASNVVHCLCLVDTPAQLHGSNLDGQWTTFDELLAMVRNEGAAPMLVGEIQRIYTVAITYKTYDRQGRRRYPVRHYRPTFRLADLPDLDVDFGDVRWLMVARDNADRPFYRLKCLWRRYVYGIDD